MHDNSLIISCTAVLLQTTEQSMADGANADMHFVSRCHFPRERQERDNWKLTARTNP